MKQAEDLRIYIEVIRRGNFSAAAGYLGFSKQYVSRRIAALEARLGVRLLNRTTRRLGPTVLGMEYYDKVSAIVMALDEADRSVSSHSRQLKGRLRVAAPLSYGLRFLPALVSVFMAQHPEAEIDLAFSDRYVDLVREGYDLAVRVGRLADSTLVARKLATVRFLTVASPAYLARHGEPENPEALRDHACLLYGHGRDVHWNYRVDNRAFAVAVHGRLLTDNGDILCHAATAGDGIAQLPDFIIESHVRDGRLKMLLQAFEPRPSAAFAVYPHHRQGSALMQTFVGAIAEALVASRSPLGNAMP
ncbi:MAG: LysR family transcriptional regulator [Zoogloeaceae bacterium]|jgi:DNA-binding transcriptional LysR family regulator|nr:LysR family transcriptional regulator [Zoogloeaceae bacterium]